MGGSRGSKLRVVLRGGGDDDDDDDDDDDTKTTTVSRVSNMNVLKSLQ